EYHHRLMQQPHGATSEVAVLAAYLVGALGGAGQLVTATAITVGTVLLLTAKDPLATSAAASAMRGRRRRARRSVTLSRSAQHSFVLSLASGAAGAISSDVAVSAILL